MPQPLPDTACLHHTPGGFAHSSIAGTLQHIIHVPQARPGMSWGSSAVSNSVVFMWTSGLRVYLQRILSMRGQAACGQQAAGLPPFPTTLKSALLAPIVPECRVRTVVQPPTDLDIALNSIISYAAQKESACVKGR